MIKKMNSKMLPSATDIISTVCRKGTDEANKIFETRMKEIQMIKKVSPLAEKESEASQNMVTRF